MSFTTDQYLTQYKIFTDDLGKIGVRHTEATKFFASLLSALVVFVGLTGPDKLLGPLGRVATFAVGFVGVVIALLWLLTARYYRNLYGAKLGVISKIETNFPLQGFAEEKISLDARWPNRITSIEMTAAGVMAFPFLLIMFAAL